MTTGIYALFDEETNECLYVGQSCDIEYRIRQHMKKLRRGTHLAKFNEWFTNSGSDLGKIRYEVLEECENNDIAKNSAEIRWFYSLSPKFYGKVPSGNETWEMSQETKDHISAGNRAYSTRIRGDVPRLIDRILVCGFCGTTYSSPSRDSMYCSRRCQGSHVKEDTIDIMVAMYEEGSTTRDISEIVGFSYKTVSRHLRNRGVPLRGRGRR